jgi:hypothetical protein
MQPNYMNTGTYIPIEFIGNGSWEGDNNLQVLLYQFASASQQKIAVQI